MRFQLFRDRPPDAWDLARCEPPGAWGSHTDIGLSNRRLDAEMRRRTADATARAGVLEALRGGGSAQGGVLRRYANYRRAAPFWGRQDDESRIRRLGVEK